MAESSSVAKRRPSSFEGQSKSAKITPYCSLRSCSTELDQEEGRVEVKSCLPSGVENAFLSKCMVDWGSSGEATFHKRCWSEVLRNARVRNKKNATMRIHPEEKTLVKEAAKTAEFHDSSAAVAASAKRIASMIRKASFCVAFTGAGISTSAGIGEMLFHMRLSRKSGKWTEQDREAATAVVSESLQESTSSIKKEETQKEEEKEEECVPYELLRPTYTHEALAKLVELGLVKHVISQNADGLHGLSGIPLDQLSELHGNIFLEICEKCSHKYYRPYYVLDDVAGQYYEELNETGQTSIAKPAHAVQCNLCELCHRTGRECTQPGCKGQLTDSIINFGDNLDEGILRNAEQVSSQADLILSMGTTMQVTPACDLVLMGKEPLRLVIANRQKTGFDYLSLRKHGKEQLGVRVFGDCDDVMREAMGQILSEEEKLEWERGRCERMKVYDSQRTEANN